MRNLICLAFALLSGCAITNPLALLGGSRDDPDGGIALVYIETARFCSRKVHTHSDFAYIRPAYETVIGNTTCDSDDGMGDASVVWWRQEGAGRWDPPPDVERKLYFEQKYRKGATGVPKTADALEALLAAAQANPGRQIRLTAYTDRGERARVGEQRLKAVRDWLAARGVSPGRVVVAESERGTQRVEAEIVVVVRG